MAKDEESNLETLKKEFEKLKTKYSLPDFKELAEEFDIERAAERESSFLLRDIRRAINDKLSAYLHLLETFMNPSSSPMFVFSMLKNLDENDKANIRQFYKRIAKTEILIFKLDTDYNEKSEADFIKGALKEWKSMKKDLLALLEKLDNNFDLNNNQPTRGYFG